ncbi:DUF6531 domain-containing protein [Pseudoalteromonas viridis]|uniref:RHS repeat protein n=1 Tax=Pseudoalteromonas viridis TaxID=339617 RepID=A0ABX7VBW8_9GAMM|nr:DUF6531 domain-containing protein [Pseudoalteromonas viridis]QTL38035.1 RHS repeat protein [Pseudoalteromonas viridis]
MKISVKKSALYLALFTTNLTLTTHTYIDDETSEDVQTLEWGWGLSSANAYPQDDCTDCYGGPPPCKADECMVVTPGDDFDDYEPLDINDFIESDPNNYYDAYTGDSFGGGGSSVKEELECTTAGNPVRYQDGAKVEEFVDFIGGGLNPISISRTYDSSAAVNGSFGWYWRTILDVKLDNFRGPGQYHRHYSFKKVLDNGEKVYFKSLDGVNYEATGDVEKYMKGATVVKQSNGTFEFTSSKGDKELYSADGKLIKVTSENGVSHSFIRQSGQIKIQSSNGNYVKLMTSGGRVVKLIDQLGQEYIYNYYKEPILSDGYSLKSITFPDGNSISYTYAKSPYINSEYNYSKLTGVYYNSVRYSWFEYESDGKRAVSSSHANGIDRHTFKYESVFGGKTVEITNPLGHKVKYSFEVGKETEKQSLPSTYCPGMSLVKTYDDNGYIKTVTNENGYVTEFDYNSVGDVIKKVVAKGTSEEAVYSYLWHPNGKILSETGPGYVLNYTYNSRGDVSRREKTDHNLSVIQYADTTYTYHANNQINTIKVVASKLGDSPSWYYYDTKGNLTQTIEKGLKTTYSSYDALGRVGKISYPTGLVETFTYYPRGEVKTKVTTDGQSSAKIEYKYNVMQQVTQEKHSTGLVIDYTYDQAFRLTKIQKK